MSAEAAYYASRKKASNYPETRGQLIYAQAILTPNLPYQLLDFPQDDSGFPNDSTEDQFFNAGQFDAYQALGHCLGQKAADLDGKPSPQPSKQSSPQRILRFPRLGR